MIFRVEMNLKLHLRTSFVLRKFVACGWTRQTAHLRLRAFDRSLVVGGAPGQVDQALGGGQRPTESGNDLKFERKFILYDL